MSKLTAEEFIDKLEDIITDALLFIDDLDTDNSTQQDLAYWRGKRKGLHEIATRIDIWKRG